MLADFRELLKLLESRPLIAEQPRRRRHPQPVSSFLKRNIAACKADGEPVMRCITMAYCKAKRKGLL